VLGTAAGALALACVAVTCCLWWFRRRRVVIVQRDLRAPVEHVFAHLARGEAPVDVVFAARQSNWADF